MIPGEFLIGIILLKKNLLFILKLKKTPLEKEEFIFQFGDYSSKILSIKKLLNEIGYKTDFNNKYDLKFKLVVEAFQRRFFPFSVNGIIDEFVSKDITSS